MVKFLRRHLLQVKDFIEKGYRHGCFQFILLATVQVSNSTQKQEYPISATNEKKTIFNQIFI